MKINSIIESRDMCNVCGQTPCNCTHLTESAENIGSQIKSLYQKIYNAGDDAVEFAYYDSPIFAQYWDEYEGDLDSIIAEVDPSELQVILDELQSAVEDQGLAEGQMPKTWHDVDKKLGRAVDKMSQAEKVKKGLAHPDTLKKQGVAEGSEQMVGFHLDSERAYEAVMAKFGHVIDHDEDSGTMYVPERLWPTVEATAYDADGIGAQRDDELENPEHYGVDEGEKVGNMDADQFDAAMARLKKLAGAGPLKTVWDPQKRVYKNVPTAVQPAQQPKK